MYPLASRATALPPPVYGCILCSAGGRRSGCAWSCGAPDRTLNEKDIAGVRARILKALEREFQATLR
jgi:hypothetical protein